MSKIKKVLAYGSALGTLLALQPGSALAALDSINIQPSDAEFQNLNNIRPSGVISTIINIFLGLAGIIAFIMLLWGGLQWILAGGDKEGTEKARKKITSALIGLALVFSAYAILFLVRAFFGIDVVQLDVNPIPGA